MAKDGKRVRQPSQDDAHLDRVVEPEYASISGKAIFAMILAGIGTVAFLPAAFYLPLPWTWFQFPLLLVVPLATIPAALVAMRSIRRSEGTVVGLGLAQAALVVAVVVTLGAAGFHGVRQYHQYSLQQALVRATDKYLDAVLTNKPQLVFDELLRTDPGWEKHQGQFQMMWRYIQRYLYEAGGEYYGRRLQMTRIQSPESPQDGPYDVGTAVHRLRFKAGAMDLTFVYQLIGGRWQLYRFEGMGQVAEWPASDEAPKLRFDKD